MSEATGTSPVDQARLGRLRFRSWHRGTREMDLLLGSFADARLPSFTAAQLDRFEGLLTIGDPDLYSWMTGAETVPADYDHDVMQMLAAHRFAGTGV